MKPRAGNLSIFALGPATGSPFPLRHGWEILGFVLALTFPWLLKWRVRVGASLLALAACATLAAACTGSSYDAGSSAPPGGAGAPADAGPDSGDVGVNIAFIPPEKLQLQPKEARELTVQTDPPGSFRVHFALPGTGGDDTPGDAALDVSEAQSSADGIAHVTLTAPSTPASFSVRASVGRLPALLGISVSMLGYTSLLVIPSYSGQRPIETWTATARAGADCSALVGNPPPDGPLSVTVPATDPIVLQRVPIGVNVAVTLRAGHYIGGCTNVSALSERDGNQTLVYASDRPLNLAATDLALGFGPSDSRPAFDKLMQASATQAAEAIASGAPSDVTALLDEMFAATAASDRPAFTAARAQGDWESALGTAFGKNAARRLRDPALRWLDAGLVTFDAVDTFFGDLAASKDSAFLTLSRVVQADPTSAGFPNGFQTIWSADSSDTLLLGTELTWLPSRLVTALAEPAALLEFPDASNLESALAMSVDCTLVAQVLLAYGASPGSALYGTCGQSCALSTCASAVASAWMKARNASGSDLATLGFTATGAAVVGDEAEVTSLHGSWVGELVIGDTHATGSGALSASSAAK